MEDQHKTEEKTGRRAPDRERAFLTRKEEIGSLTQQLYGESERQRYIRRARRAKIERAKDKGIPRRPRSHFVRIIREELIQLYGEQCAKCGNRRALTLDHIVPRRDRGLTRLANSQLLCQPCNVRKGHGEPIDYRPFKPGAESESRVREALRERARRSSRRRVQARKTYS